MTHRRLALSALALLLASAPLAADVKTQDKTSVKFGGTLGSIVNRFAGDAAKDGVVNTTAVRGARKMTLNPATGQIIDLSEEKVYDIDVRKKEYRVTTFAELRQRWQDAQTRAKKDVADMKDDKPDDPQTSGKQFEISVSVKETGQSKPVAGHPAREVILTITMHEKGKSVEDGGGLVMTNDMWIAPKIAALDEIGQFDLKFAKAIYGDMPMSLDPPQMSMLLASYPSFQEMAAKMAAEGKKLEGTPLAVTMTLDAVKSPEQMKEAQASQAAPAGGGLTGRLASRFMPKPKATEARTTAFTSTHETLSIDTAVSDGDTALPAGYKEKK